MQTQFNRNNIKNRTKSLMFVLVGFFIHTVCISYLQAIIEMVTGAYFNSKSVLRKRGRTLFVLEFFEWNSVLFLFDI